MAHLRALVALGCVATVIGFSPARAGEELHLSWSGCDLDAGATHTRTFNCLDNLAVHPLHVAFTLGAAVDSVIGMEVVVDLQSAENPLPDWWRLDTSGCRAGALTADIAFGTTSCPPALGATAVTSFPSYTVTMPRGGANQARIKVGIGVPGNQAQSLQTGVTYQAVRLLLHSTRTDSCGGCGVGVCLVLNSILLKRPPLAPGGNVMLSTPGPFDANWVDWQGDRGDCVSVPVRTRTWGAIKATYR